MIQVIEARVVHSKAAGGGERGCGPDQPACALTAAYDDLA